MTTFSAASSTQYVDWASMWKILVISIGAGAGLVVVYSVGLLAWSASGYFRPGDDQVAQRNMAALAGAILCLAIVAAGAVYGIHVIFNKG
jgi:hypothetical protein